jgi:Asp-tRNA(Asn)/Glu-tRNA(Gln) amidotransferase A subunit family amidase
MMQAAGAAGKAPATPVWRTHRRSASVGVGNSGFRMSQAVFLPITELSRRIESGALDPRELVQAYLERANGVGRPINAYVALREDAALVEAASSAQRASHGRRLGALDGIPVAVKDNIDVAGLPTTNGLGGARQAVAAADAEVVRRLREAGAIVLGKLNMHEGALGAVNDNPHHGRTINPFRDGFTPGGSSGGSGAALAAGLCAATLGTDTGGSVRIPAAYCGVVGLKPSFGLVSARGVVPLSSRLDHVGPLTRTVADAALMLAVMAGPDPAWTYTRCYPRQDYGRLEPATCKGMRIGVLANYAPERMQAAIGSAFARAVALFASLGAEAKSVRLPTYNVVRGRRAVFVRVEVEAAASLGALYDSEPERFSADMRGFLDWGRNAPAVRLCEADRTIGSAAHELDRCFADVAAIIAPTTPQAAFPFGGKAPDTQGDFCVLANMAGCAAISLPMGVNEDGLPLGLQIMTPRGQDLRALAVAAAYEAAAGWQLAPPPPLGPS